MFYAEQATTNGRWTPVTFDTPPVMKGDRIKRASGVGPRLRQLGTDEKGKPRFCRPIGPFHEKLKLDQLRAIYSLDGALQCTGPSVEDDGFVTVVPEVSA